MKIKNSILFCTILFLPIVFFLELFNLQNSDYFFILLLLMLLTTSMITANLYELLPGSLKEDKSLYYPTLAKISLTIILDLSFYFIYTVISGFFSLSLNHLC